MERRVSLALSRAEMRKVSMPASGSKVRDNRRELPESFASIRRVPGILARAGARLRLRISLGIGNDHAQADLACSAQASK